MSEQQAFDQKQNETVDETELSPEMRTMITGVSDAINASLIAVLRQVIKGQLAMADGEKAMAELRTALADAREKARSGRRLVQLTLIDLIDAELAQQLDDWRALVTADDAEDLLRLRLEQFRATLARQSVSFDRLQQAQTKAVAETFEPVAELFRTWRSAA